MKKYNFRKMSCNDAMIFNSLLTNESFNNPVLFFDAGNCAISLLYKGEVLKVAFYSKSDIRDFKETLQYMNELKNELSKTIKTTT